MYSAIFSKEKKHHLIKRLEGINNKLLLGPNDRLQVLKNDVWLEYRSITQQEEMY